jgi:hypothetical protein
VQASAAGTSYLAGGLCKIPVDCKQEGPEPGVARQTVIHGQVLRSCDNPRSTPLGILDQVIGLAEGIFHGGPSDLAQESRIPRRLPCPRSVPYQALPSVFVHQCQPLEMTTADCAIMDKVAGPHVVLERRRLLDAAIGTDARLGAEFPCFSALKAVAAPDHSRAAAPV